MPTYLFSYCIWLHPINSYEEQQIIAFLSSPLHIIHVTQFHANMYIHLEKVQVSHAPNYRVMPTGESKNETKNRILGYEILHRKANIVVVTYITPREEGTSSEESGLNDDVIVHPYKGDESTRVQIFWGNGEKLINIRKIPVHQDLILTARHIIASRGFMVSLWHAFSIAKCCLCYTEVD